MKILFVSFLIFTLIPTLSFSQDNTSSGEIERISYQYFLTEKWDSLIIVGENAIKNNTDYFYLRVRLGVAYYHKMDYEKSYTHFAKATEYNADDEFTNQYLKKVAIATGKITDKSQLIKYYDELTYRHYIDGNWDALITIGNEAISKNIDFFFLQTRMGIAYMNKEKFIQALRHFDIVLKLEPDNDFVLTKAAFCNKYIGRNLISYYYMKQMSDSAFRNIKLSPAFHNASFTIDYGILGNNINSVKPLSFQEKVIIQTNDRNLNASQLNFSLKSRLLKSFEVYVSENYLNIQKEKSFWYYQPFLKDSSLSDLPSAPPNLWVYSYDSLAENKSFKYDLKQHAIYGSISCRVLKSFSFNIAASFIADSYKKYNLLSPVKRINSLNNVPKENTKYRFEEVDTTVVFTIFNFSMTKFFNNFTLSLAYNISDLNFANQSSFGVSAFYYPFGNLNFYGKTELAFFAQKYSEQSNNEKRIIISQMIGAKMNNFIWIEANGNFGGLGNYAGIYGTTPYNSTDLTNYSAGGKLIFPINSNLQLEFSYTYMDMDNPTLLKKYSTTTTGQKKNKVTTSKYITESEYSNYQYHLLKGGIIWKL